MALFVFVAFVFGLLTFVPAVQSVPKKGCHFDPAVVPTNVVSPQPYEYLSLSQLPLAFDWRNVNGTNFVTKIGNQLQPKFCGSCWAFATTSALSDRIKITTKAKNPDINLSPQVLLDCGQIKGAGSCDGGSSALANQFIHNFGITDDTCSPYMAVDYNIGSELPCEQNMCRTCDRFGTCSTINGTKYYVDEYGNIKGETQMLAEIFARGPIVCAMYAHSDSFENYRGGIITDPTKYYETTHAISLVGWGQTADGLKYWIGRNSFGTYWGEQGWFRIQRGTNCLLIETSCHWATPLLKPAHT